MPFGSVKLRPGVSVDWTPTLNEAGISESQLIRFKDSLAQKMGGWTKFYPFGVAGVPRALHGWQDLNQVSHLMIGTTTNLSVVTNGNLQDLTPQTLLSDFAPDFSTTSTDDLVEVDDPNIANVTTFDSVFFNTPVSVGGLILSGLCPIFQITGATSYLIRATIDATATVANGGAVPEFTTTINAAIANVMLEDHGLSVGQTAVFPIPTTVGGIIIDGSYSVTSVVDVDNFEIQLSSEATATDTVEMNGGDAQLLYYITLGPASGGIGYGLGGYGEGGYGTGVVPSSQTGTPITATDYTLDNWGEIGLACPANGGIYYWEPTGGFQNMALVSGAPIFNSGIFVSTSQQILIAYGSSINKALPVIAPDGFGVIQDPMLVAWSDSENFGEWDADADNFAGNYRIPLGSRIMGGLAGPSQNLIWTDLDLWAMNFIGQPDVFGFNMLSAGAGLASRHAMARMRGGIYWMGLSNFYEFAGGGARVVPCPVWDAVFQNLNIAYAANIRAMPNTAFNEVGFLYPSLASANGENDSYVKWNITEPGAPWDMGMLPRSAWMDQSVFGLSPISATPSGIIYTQESGNDADGSPLQASFTTAYFMLADGEDYVMVDQVLPDFIWGTYAGAKTAQVQLTFNVVNYPGDAVRTYGPYTVTQATKMINVRFRGRQMSITVASNDIGSFWRLGRVRYRFAPQGRH